MNGRDHRSLYQPAVGERQEIEAVVEYVELVGPFEGVGDVEAFGHLWVDAVVFGPAGRRGTAHLCRAQGIGGGEERHVVAPLDETFGQQRRKQLPWTVVARWGPPGNGREDGYS